MSAIWGCIDLSGNSIDTELPDKMEKCLTKYKIDKIEKLVENNVFMACGLQYITKESRYEKLPCAEDGVYFTADCIIDNRDELIRELGVSVQVPDGELLFRAFKKWRESFGDHVLGLFSFAIYDSNTSQFHLFTDHTSSRCIYYHMDGDKIYFGTFSSCITDALPDIRLCEKWMVASQVLDIAYCFLYDGLTPFEEVYILPYGSGISVKKVNGCVSKKQIRYWDPLKTIKEEKTFDDDKCKARFIKTHIECVESVLRTEGNVSIQLSSGLDSTSVASVAAPILKKECKKLYSYTSIPIKEFRDMDDGKDKYEVDDESEGVRKFCSHFPNIVPTFLDCEGENFWTYMEEWCDYMEFPCKSLVNHVWIHDSIKESVKNDVKVVLSGEYGNYTISYGDIKRTVYLLLKSGHLIEAYRQLIDYASTMKYSKKKYLKYYFNVLRLNGKGIDIDFDENGFKMELADEYSIRKDWEKLFENQGVFLKTKKQYRNSLISGHLFQLFGVMNTKDGLYHGVIMRDPTMDKRMLELCLRLPFKCFAWNGTERRLVREYLAEYVPEEIRLDVRHRGRQSGDAALRLNKFGYPGGAEAFEALSEKLKKFYDLDKVKEYMKKEAVDEDLDWRAKVMACSFFLEKYLKK